ncbi:MAG: hypothetical protein N2319_01205 [Candidatus Kapabacteria bacterium]|nr:hypothetical protein [Candidatus Kapabacteria bacterium]
MNELTYSHLRDYRNYGNFSEENQIDKLVRLALESNVPFYKNPVLHKQLSQFDFSESTDDAMKLVINEIIEFVKLKDE